MRAFVAVWASPAVAREASAHGAALSAWVSNPRLVHPDDAHVTLRFLGERTEAELEALVGELAAVVASCEPPPLTSAFRSAFPSLERARVAVLEIEDERGAWVTLEQRVGAVLDAHGMRRDHAVYRPHLTLARLARPADLARWAAGETVALPPSTPTHVVVAAAAPDGPRRYRRLVELPMVAPAPR